MKRLFGIFAVCSMLVLAGPANAQDSQLRKLFPIIDDGKIGYIDDTGAIVIRPQFDGALNGSSLFNAQNLLTLNFSEGFAGIPSGGKWGFIDQSGKVVIKPQFRAVWYFSEGLAQIHIGNRSGYVDKSGRMVIPPLFIGYSPFSEGLAGVNVGTDEKPKWGYIDKTGEFAIKPRFSYGGTFSEGLASVRGKTENGFINTNGMLVITLPDRMGSDRFSDGLARVFTTPEGLIGFIDKTGKIVISPRRWMPGDFSEGLSAACYIKALGMNCGYIDHEGKTVIEPQYAVAGPFSEGLAPVCVALDPIPNKQCGFIDKTGRLVIPMEFTVAYGFKGGLALVGVGTVYPEKWGYINKAGEYVWRPTK